MLSEKLEGGELFDLDEALLPHETPEGDELGFAAVVTSLFVKMVKARRYYPPEYPRLRELHQEFITVTCRFLTLYHALTLEITELEFVMNGQTLYRASDLNGSIPFAFYRDGVRELRLVDGVTERQLTELVDLLAQAEQIDHAEDDLVTLLWERDFAQIEFLATDDFLEEVPIEVPESVEEFRDKVVLQPVIHEDIDLDALPPAETAAEAAELTGGALRARKDVFALTTEEMRELREAVERETGPLAVTHTSEILFDLFTMERNPEIYQIAVDVQLCILETLIGLRAYRQAADLLAHAHRLRGGFDLEDWPYTMLTQLIDGVAEPALMERIEAAVREAGDLPLPELQRLLALMPPTVVPRLIGLLAETTDARISAMLCETLADLGRNDMEQFVPFLIDPRWELVRDVLDILSRIGQDRLVPYLERAFAHTDARVRREIVQTAAGLEGARSERLLIRALADPDEEVRCLGATGLGRRRNLTALAPLLHAVHAKTFRQRPLAEIKALLHGIGLSGSNHALDTLRELLLVNAWFQRARADAIREYAAHALAMIGTPEAAAILDEGAKSGQAGLRKVCRQALATLAQMTNSRRDGARHG